ncbi:MAG TPA: hypothetical protein VJS86_11075, partial [Arthrobacter sp.]|nr:hypothetical protein [Arthrobacter sp.]
SPVSAAPSEVARPVVELAAALWAGMGGSAPRRPVAPPLPDVLTDPADVAAATADGPVPQSPADHGSVSQHPVDHSSVHRSPGPHGPVHHSPAPHGPAPHGLTPAGTAPGGAAGDWAVGLGLLDVPDEQRLSDLTWRPGSDGHLALMGTGSGDAACTMSRALQELLVHPTECHLYVLDADGSLAGLAGAPRTGSLVSLNDLRRGVRVLERLAAEVSQRLSRLPAGSGPPLVLAISGWGSWLSALRSGPLTRAEDHVQDIVRDGRPAGVTVLISGDRELTTSRFFPAIPNRVYCPRDASAESRLTWPKMPDLPPIPGRGIASGPLCAGQQRVCQLYAPGTGGAAPERGTAPGEALQGPVRVKPFRVDPLPARLSVAEVLARMSGTVPLLTAARDLVVGMGGDEPAPASVRLRGGAVLAVLGSAGSGKSSFLASLPVLNPSLSGWVRPCPERNPADFWTHVHRDAVEGRLPRDAFLLVDDADLLPPASHQHLADLNSRGCAVIFSAAFSQSLVQRVPLSLAARSGGKGILIAPRTPLDGDIFGLRIEPDSHPPPGRALLVADGTALPVQLAIAEECN